MVGQSIVVYVGRLLSERRSFFQAHSQWTERRRLDRVESFEAATADNTGDAGHVYMMSAVEEEGTPKSDVVREVA